MNGPTNVVTDTTWNYNITDVAISGVSSAGTDYCQACALRGDGQVWCWGFNGNGNLGLCSLPLPSLLPFCLLCMWSGCLFGCVDGAGDGSTTTRPYAMRVSHLGNIKAIFSQQFNTNSMFALENDSVKLWAWGYNANYNLGIYQSDVMYAPVVVHGLRLTRQV